MFVTVLVALAIHMIAVAIRGVPVLGAPRCGSCGQVTGMRDGLRCAECGALRDGAGAAVALAYGWRCRSWPRAALAAALLAVGAVFGVVCPGAPELAAHRIILGTAFAAGLRSPIVLDRAAGAMTAELAAGADAGAVTDALLAALGPTPGERLQYAYRTQNLLADVGGLAITRGDRVRIDALAEAVHPLPRFDCRRRHRPGADVCIDATIAMSLDGPGFFAMIVPIAANVGGELQTPRVIHSSSSSWSDARWLIRAPAAAGSHEVEIRWQQVILPVLVFRPDGGADTSNAVWTRTGSFEITIEVVADSAPILEAVDDPALSPWRDGREALKRFELRDVDDRMLVSMDIGGTLHPGIAFAGRWFAIQDGIERPLHAQALTYRPSSSYFEYGWRYGDLGHSLISPRLDPGRPIRVVFRPNLTAAEKITSYERCWSGVTEFTIMPESLQRDPIAADPTWSWAP